MTVATIRMYGVPAQGTLSATTQGMMRTVLCVNMLISTTTVGMQLTPCTCSTIISTPWSTRSSTCGGLIGGLHASNLAPLILYYSTNRMTVFTFLKDPTQEETTIEFTGEDPYLQYVSACNQSHTQGLVANLSSE